MRGIIVYCWRVGVVGCSCRLIVIWVGVCCLCVVASCCCDVLACCRRCALLSCCCCVL